MPGWVRAALAVWLVLVGVSPLGSAEGRAASRAPTDSVEHAAAARRVTRGTPRCHAGDLAIPRRSLAGPGLDPCIPPRPPRLATARHVSRVRPVPVAAPPARVAIRRPNARAPPA